MNNLNIEDNNCVVDTTTTVNLMEENLLLETNDDNVVALEEINNQCGRNDDCTLSEEVNDEQNLDRNPHLAMKDPEDDGNIVAVDTKETSTDADNQMGASAPSEEVTDTASQD